MARGDTFGGAAEIRGVATTLIAFIIGSFLGAMVYSEFAATSDPGPKARAEQQAFEDRLQDMDLIDESSRIGSTDVVRGEAMLVAGRTEIQKMSATQTEATASETAKEWDGLETGVSGVWDLRRARALMLPKSEDPEKWIGKRREDLGNQMYSDEWINASTNVALADGRPMVMCPHAMLHAGQGNAQFVAGGIVALAARFGFLPVVPCKKFGKLHTSPFYNFHCIGTKDPRIKWAGAGDGGTLPDPGYQAKMERLARSKTSVNLNGYFQHYSAMAYARDAICWAMRPNPVTTQVSVMEYYKDYVIGNASIHMNEHSNLVAVHVRRGDYIRALSKQYYKDAWQLVRSKAGLHDGEAGKNLIVLVFCAGNAEKWSRENLADAFPGAKHVRFVVPKVGGRSPKSAEDILLISLADYFILANSTFGWWGHFYSECRRRFAGWWEKAWGHPRRSPKEKIFVMPYRWHKGADTTGRSQTFNYIMGDYLIPGTNPNEIYEKRKDGTPW